MCMCTCKAAGLKENSRRLLLFHWLQPGHAVKPGHMRAQPDACTSVNTLATASCTPGMYAFGMLSRYCSQTGLASGHT